MISCPVCGEQNDDLAVVCRSCKSYIQAKVDTLDLFSTVWGLIESPSATFKRIVLSRNKNYVIALSCFFGIALVYAAFWYRSLGRLFANVLIVLGAGLFAGPLVGIVFTLTSAFLVRGLARLFGGRSTIKNMFSVFSYAMVPVLFSLVLVLPVEVAVFGSFFFDNNPSPLVISPIIYLALLGLDAIAAVWSWILLVLGTKVVHGFTMPRALAVIACATALFGLVAYGLRTV
jgi:hypothetical protein